MESITLGQIIVSFGGLSVIAGFLAGIFKWYKKNITDEFAKLNQELHNHMDQSKDKIKEIEDNVNSQKNEIEESKQERLILLKGVLACLKGLHNDLNCNGPVTQGIAEVEEYLINKSHK